MCDLATLDILLSCNLKNYKPLLPFSPNSGINVMVCSEVALNLYSLFQCCDVLCCAVLFFIHTTLQETFPYTCLPFAVLVFKDDVSCGANTKYFFNKYIKSSILQSDILNALWDTHV